MAPVTRVVRLDSDIRLHDVRLTEFERAVPQETRRLRKTVALLETVAEPRCARLVYARE